MAPFSRSLGVIPPQSRFTSRVVCEDTDWVRMKRRFDGAFTFPQFTLLSLFCFFTHFSFSIFQHWVCVTRFILVRSRAQGEKGGD